MRLGLFRFLRKKRNESRMATSPVLALPTELLISIIEHVDDRRTLIGLCRVSKQFLAAARIGLYEDMRIICSSTAFAPPQALLNTRRLRLLWRTMHSSSIAALVRHVRLTFQYCHANDQVAGSKPSITCDCYELDELIGHILRSLPNLQVLQINCACHLSISHHTYLYQLQTNQLRELQFRCNKMSLAYIGQLAFLGAPCLKDIKTLLWLLPSTPKKFVREAEEVANTEQLPQVDRLYCSHLPIVKWFMKSRPPTHLICYDDEKRIVNTISTHGVHLQHLTMSDAAPALVAIAKDASLYRALTHLGTLKIDGSDAYSSLESTTVLGQLTHLRSLEVESRRRKKVIKRDSVDDYDYHAVVRQLGEQIPSLQKVYASIFVMDANGGWERWILERGSTWEKRRGEGFTSWTIMRSPD